MQFDDKSLRRIVKSVHATEKMQPDWGRRAIPSGAYRYVILEQVVPVLGPESQKVRADIYTMDMTEVIALDVDVWFIDYTLFGESSEFIGVCTYNNDKFWHVDPLRGVPYYNESGYTIPANGAVQITAGLSPSGTFIKVKQPDSVGVAHPGLILINSEYDIPAGNYGIANVRPSMVARINTGDGAVAIGDDVGPRSGSFDLWARGKGFTLLAAAGAGFGIVETNDNVLEIVRVTSDTPDELGLYDGSVQRYNPIAMVWETLFTCKVLDANE